MVMQQSAINHSVTKAHSNFFAKSDIPQEVHQSTGGDDTN